MAAPPEDELRPLEKSGRPEPEALAEPELPLAPALLACEPAELLEGMEGIDDEDDDDDDEGMDGIEDDDDEEDEEDDGIDGIDDELLLDDDDEDDEDEDDGIWGMLDDCCDCCVDSHALSNSAATLRHNRIRVRGIFIFTDSNRRSQCLKCTVIKTGSRHHYCVSVMSLSIS